MRPKVEPDYKPHRATQLRVFYSVDLVGGTAYKNREPVDDHSSARSWPNRFEGFFQDFTRSFKERVAVARSDTEAGLMPPPQLWKINGDELLFTELVYEDHAQRHAALHSAVRSFIELVHETDESYISEGLGVRACAWTAGFPIRNKPVRIIQGGIELIEGDAGLSDPETGPGSSVPVTVTDYIGRDMDIGFRLAAGAPPGRVVCSLDLAHFVLALPFGSDLTVRRVGWARLKGVLNEQPYPLLWLEDKRQPRARHPWDESDGTGSSPEVREFLRAGNRPLTRDDFHELASRVRALSAGQLIVPYASLDDMPPQHRQQYLERRGPDPTRDLRAEAGMELEADDFAVSSGHAETITLDDLHQLLLWLQEHPERVPEVRAILTEIAAHETYGQWLVERQFAGDLFRLHPSLAFASSKRRWLLESLLLIKNEALRVKINLRGDQVFITDGLWVDPSIRAFPFSDESDLVMRACEESGWMDWATCVIDPATGCGHNLLRYEGRGVRRFGFDRNARALAYASINAALNGIDEATFGNRDIRDGIPSLFQQGSGERILVVANMPFALVPNHDAIARSADGGRHGYELTLALLEAFDGLAARLDGASELRCVVLTYSVGALRDGSWVVPDYAAERFGSANVTWRLWEDEKLWRVNGKKEQVNPMPLPLLKRKADCRFYVRGDIAREALRREYEQLTEELAREGLDHLAYGVITVRHPSRDGGGRGTAPRVRRARRGPRRSVSRRG